MILLTWNNEEERRVAFETNGAGSRHVSKNIYHWEGPSNDTKSKARHCKQVNLVQSPPQLFVISFAYLQGNVCVVLCVCVVVFIPLKYKQEWFKFSWQINRCFHDFILLGFKLIWYHNELQVNIYIMVGDIQKYCLHLFSIL